MGTMGESLSQCVTKFLTELKHHSGFSQFNVKFPIKSVFYYTAARQTQTNTEKH